MLSKISTSDNYGGAENFENFFTKTNQIFRLSQGLWCGNFWKVFSSRPTKFSASAKCGGAENFEFFFSMLTKISASDNYGGTENFEIFFLKG